MYSFKSHFVSHILESQSVETEAMIVLRKIIDMVDDGHVDYSSNKIKINVGKLIKNKKYDNLVIYIKAGKTDYKLGRHKNDNKYAMFFYTPKLPQRENIDDFLSDQTRSSKFKETFLKFFNDAVFEDNGKDSEYEKSTNLNQRNAFEKSYIELVDKLNKQYEHYESATKEIQNKIDNSNHDLGHHEVLKISLNKLKKDMVGSNVQEFKSKAIDLYGKENYKLLNSEYRTKLDSRLSDYYEQKY